MAVIDNRRLREELRLERAGQVVTPPPRQFKSLVDICQEQIMKKCIGKIETLDVLFVANELSLEHLREECMRTIRFKYAFFKEITEEGYLQQLCGEEAILEFEQSLAETNRFRRNSRQEGVVLEKPQSELVPVDAQAYDAQGNRIFYPKAALISGVKWPTGIDASKREEWLSDEEFEATFGMDKASFALQNKFKKERLKKEKGLW